MRKTKENEINVAGLIVTVLIIFSIFFVLAGSWYTVPAGHRAVLLTWGKPTMEAMQEGFHLKIPIAQKAIRMEVRTQKIEVTADSASKDLQDIQTTIALNFHVNPESTPRLYKEIGKDYMERIIHPAIQETAKSITAQFTAEELITKRTEVRNGMKQQITERLQKSYLKVDDFNIVNFQFSEEFDKAIEQKVTAEQMALKAQRDLERIIIEKEQKIAEAQAEAESLRLQKQQITPDLIKLREIEVQRKAIEKWDGILPQITGGAMPFIQVPLEK